MAGAVAYQPSAWTCLQWCITPQTRHPCYANDEQLRRTPRKGKWCARNFIPRMQKMMVVHLSSSSPYCIALHQIAPKCMSAQVHSSHTQQYRCNTLSSADRPVDRVTHVRESRLTKSTLRPSSRSRADP